jgi:hypothetical protein
MIKMNRLTVAFFATSDANYAACMDDYLAGANAMLAKYGMSVDIFPTNPAGGPRIIPFSGPAFDASEDPNTMRAQAHKAVPVGRGIPVIFCKRNSDGKSDGTEMGSTIQTSSSANGGVGWLPYILINTQNKSTSNEVILHEMIHAAYGESLPNHPGGTHDTDASSAFYGYGSTANGGADSGKPIRNLPAKHADVLRKAYFSYYAP